MKTDKPAVITIPHRTEGALVQFMHKELLNALQPLDRCDYVHFENDTEAAHLLHCKDSGLVNVGTLRDVLKTWTTDRAGTYEAAPGELLLWEDKKNHPRNVQHLFWREVDHYETTNEGAYCRPHGERRSVFCAMLDLNADIQHTEKADPWLALAVSKDKARPALQKVYGNAIAADAYRVHIDHTKPEPAEMPFDYRVVSPLPGNTITLADPKALARAMKTAKTVDRDVCKWSVNGSLDIIATDEENGTTRTIIAEGYQHAGPDVTIGINPGYVLDAISGMKKGPLTVVIGGPSRPLSITDGKREAIIMTVNIG